MLLRINDKKYNVNFLWNPKPNTEVWEVTTPRKRWLGTFSTHTNSSMKRFEQKVRKAIENDGK